MWFDFKYQIFKIFDVLSLKECAVKFDGLIRIVEANGLKIDDDELYNRQLCSELFVKDSEGERVEKPEMSKIFLQNQHSKFTENCEIYSSHSSRQCRSGTYFQQLEYGHR